MKFIFDLAKDEVQGPILTKLDAGSVNKISMRSMMGALAANMPFETGLMPTGTDGVLSIRKGFGFEQIVYQRQPGIYAVKWGERERDPAAQFYQLAHPWRIIIADFQDGNLLGVRHFYSPESILSLDQQLYAVNLPNTNTIGYNGTSVGWVCLYRNDNTTTFTMDEKIRYMLERESGSAEPYNDSNMSGTDGTRYYQRKMKAPAYMWDRAAWAAKSAAEGYEWICDEKLLVPLRIRHDDIRAMVHVEDNDDEVSYNYTLRHAMYGEYSAYYTDKTQVKPINVLVTHGWEGDVGKDVLLSPIVKALNVTLPKQPKEAPIVVENLAEALRAFSGVTLQDIPQVLKRNILLGYYCDQCKEHKSYTDSEPRIVYDMVQKADGNFQTEDGEILALQDDAKYLWDYKYSLIDGCYIVAPVGKWCPTCVRRRSISPENYFITVPEDKVYLTTQSFYYNKMDEKFEFAVDGIACPHCHIYHRNENDQAVSVFKIDENGDKTAVSCIYCTDKDDYLDQVSVVLSTDPDGVTVPVQLQLDKFSKPIITHVAKTQTVVVAGMSNMIAVNALPDSFAIQVASYMVDILPPHSQLCACSQIVPENYPLTTTADGVAKVCNSCVNFNKEYCSVYTKITQTEQGQ